jgi:excisionase family DNA binding protein
MQQQPDDFDRGPGPLTVEETARAYRIKLKPLKQAIDDGRVPHIKLGRAIYLVRSVFEKWLETEAESGRKTV